MFLLCSTARWVLIMARTKFAEDGAATWSLSEARAMRRCSVREWKQIPSHGFLVLPTAGYRRDSAVVAIVLVELCVDGGGVQARKRNDPVIGDRPPALDLHDRISLPISSAVQLTLGLVATFNAFQPRRALRKYANRNRIALAPWLQKLRYGAFTIICTILKRLLASDPAVLTYLKRTLRHVRSLHLHLVELPAVALQNVFKTLRPPRFSCSARCVRGHRSQGWGAPGLGLGFAASHQVIPRGRSISQRVSDSARALYHPPIQSCALCLVIASRVCRGARLHLHVLQFGARWRNSQHALHPFDATTFSWCARLPRGPVYACGTAPSSRSAALQETRTRISGSRGRPTESIIAYLVSSGARQLPLQYLQASKYHHAWPARWTIVFPLPPLCAVRHAIQAIHPPEKQMICYFTSTRRGLDVLLLKLRLKSEFYQFALPPYTQGTRGATGTRARTVLSRGVGGRCYRPHPARSRLSCTEQAPELDIVIAMAVHWCGRGVGRGGVSAVVSDAYGGYIMPRARELRWGFYLAFKGDICPRLIHRVLCARPGTISTEVGEIGTRRETGSCWRGGQRRSSRVEAASVGLWSRGIDKLQCRTNIAAVSTDHRHQRRRMRTEDEVLDDRGIKIDSGVKFNA
ncbi:hypothetical protein B0H16DRAFT_1480698 [Mycena metata]|uniref:Uncharacterized protein n=1 Tax=Mycena metata TaxID=1033252 RepID=A0AAD7H1P2_9AGAR|nr:hypothetical protein B0H16DRAFT_1480698 [Mycena metata]